MDRSGTLVEAPKATRGVEYGRQIPSPENLLFDLRMEHFAAVFKLDLMEETRTQLQEEETVASSCLVLATTVGGNMLSPVSKPSSVSGLML